MQLKPCGYLVLVTQDTASSNCSRCECCPFGDIACLALDSCLVLTKVRTAHKTLTSPSVTLRKLSLLILTLFNQNSTSVIKFKQRQFWTTTRSYNGNFIYCNKWLCNIIEISFQGRDNTNIRKDNILIFTKVGEMFEQVKNVIADEETTCEPKRIRRFRFRNSIYHIFLFNGTDSSCLDIIRIQSVICGRSSPHIFLSKRVKNLSGWQNSACTPNINFLLYCEYHRDHMFRSTIARQAKSSYLIVRRGFSTDLFI